MVIELLKVFLNGIRDMLQVQMSVFQTLARQNTIARSGVIFFFMRDRPLPLYEMLSTKSIFHGINNLQIFQT